MLAADVERDALLASGAALNPALFVRIDWPTGLLLMHSDKGQIEVAGEIYLGMGSLGSMSAAPNADAGATDQITLGITGIPEHLMSEPFDRDAIGAEVLIQSGYLGPDRKLIGGMRPVYFGFIDGPKITLSKPKDSQRLVNLEMAVSGAENPRLILSAIFSDASAPAGDSLYRHLQVQTEEEPVWPA